MGSRSGTQRVERDNEERQRPLPGNWNIPRSDATSFCVNAFISRAMLAGTRGMGRGYPRNSNVLTQGFHRMLQAGIPQAAVIGSREISEQHSYTG